MMSRASGSARRDGRWMPLAPSVRREPVPMRPMTRAIGDPESRAHDDRLQPRRHPQGRGQRHGDGTAERAQRPAGVQSGDQRAAVPRLDGHAVCVHGQVHRGVDVAKDEHDGSQRGGFRGQAKERHEQREGERGDGGDTPAVVAHQELARDLLADQRAQGCQQQHEPELAGGHAQRCLGARDAGHPRAQHRTVHEEHGQGGRSRSHAFPDGVTCRP